MIICRTPFRISFFGGGTDYPAWYRENGGATLVTTISKYCYITCRWLPPFFQHRSRIVWSKIELVRETGEIEHPAVREALQHLHIRHGIEIHHDGDLPARTGLGSSSAFTVGLLHALYGLKGVMPSKRQLALEAIRVEQGWLQENVGCQDQVAAAFGGFNRIDFERNDGIQVSPILLDPGRLVELQSRLMLYYTGISRTASEIAGEQIKATSRKKEELRAIYGMVDEAVRILQSGEDLKAFGRILHESWKLKRSLTPRISTPMIDQLYETARAAGATGGKILGAGGGGFLLLFVEPDRQPEVREALGQLLHVPVQFESSGSRIIFYDPDGYDPEEGVAQQQRTGSSPEQEGILTPG